jgi:cytochrome c oxidase assembly protein subunit 17
MAPSSDIPSKVAPVENEKPKDKICCACPETRKPRDTCIVEKGEDHCAEYIKAHKACLRSKGFKVRAQRRARA